MNWLKLNGLVPKFIYNINSAKLNEKDQIAFFTSVHDFLKNGFTLNEALKFYLVLHPQLKDHVHHIQDALSKGQSFSDSIRSFINFRTYCQIRIAEFHGNLLTALAIINQVLRVKQRQKKKIRELMMYPLFLLFLLFGIIIAIHILVAPQLNSFSSNAGHHHHLLLIGYVAVPILIIVYGIWRYCHEQGRLWQINRLLKFPMIGGIYKAYYAYYFANNLAMMMKCGMDLKQIVKFMSTFEQNSLIQALSADVKNNVNHGRSLSELRRKYQFLPQEMMILLDTGDTTPVLAEKLNSYSKVEFKVMLKRSTRFISLLQPALFLIIGLVITGTYLSMLLPMYQSIKGVY